MDRTAKDLDNGRSDLISLGHDQSILHETTPANHVPTSERRRMSHDDFVEFKSLLNKLNRNESIFDSMQRLEDFAHDHSFGMEMIREQELSGEKIIPMHLIFSFLREANDSVKSLSAIVIGSAIQNNLQGQNWCTETNHATPFLYSLTNQFSAEQSHPVRLRLIFAISAIVRNNMVGLKQLLELQFLDEMYRDLEIATHSKSSRLVEDIWIYLSTLPSPKEYGLRRFANSMRQWFPILSSRCTNVECAHILHTCTSIYKQLEY